MRVFWAAISGLMLCVSAFAQHSSFNLTDLGWLAGCWQSRDDTKRQVVHEQWMKPAGGIMLGSGLTVESDKAVDLEVMRIEQSGSDVIFYARPRANRDETAFRMVRSGANEAIFENKQHDFPQRVIYRRDGDNLVARIEGARNGRLVGVDFPMVPMKCRDERTSAAVVSHCSGRNELLPAEISDLLKAHNSVRAANGLSPLSWDCELADAAQEWADRGVFEHRFGAKYGQSLYVSTTSTAKAITAVQQWMLEKPFWDNSTGTCATGKVCTHYTQIVSRSTASIGCGINRGAAGNWRVLLVCNYHPGAMSSGPAF
jgi:hypothetical protein